MHRVALRNSVRAAALAASKVRNIVPSFPLFFAYSTVFCNQERRPQYPCCFSLICDSKGRCVLASSLESLPRLTTCIRFLIPNAP